MSLSGRSGGQALAVSRCRLPRAAVALLTQLAFKNGMITPSDHHQQFRRGEQLGLAAGRGVEHGGELCEDTSGNGNVGYQE
ncbi:hypothetical protein OOK36_56680 [Streptomyces sp. NBC_00365]|uniref:hypothetical protein n=1 Tax=Streptomyces sp. NBC_00365 TaxID=2975726 RepID=UPI00224F5368|nr:hypothetical protein [Streptomyces sp. NBC_00365]MCX5097878.1 hypothetical protein [Streptomyces sp. NBC_00365]